MSKSCTWKIKFFVPDTAWKAGQLNKKERKIRSEVKKKLKSFDSHVLRIHWIINNIFIIILRFPWIHLFLRKVFSINFKATYYWLNLFSLFIPAPESISAANCLSSFIRFRCFNHQSKILIEREELFFFFLKPTFLNSIYNFTSLKRIKGFRLMLKKMWSRTKDHWNPKQVTSFINPKHDLPKNFFFSLLFVLVFLVASSNCFQVKLSISLFSLSYLLNKLFLFLIRFPPPLL